MIGIYTHDETSNPLIAFGRDATNRGQVFQGSSIPAGSMKVDSMAVRIVGWGTTQAGLKYWNVAFSLGTEFGIDGYLWIERGSNFLGIEQTVCFPKLEQPRSSRRAAQEEEVSPADKAKMKDVNRKNLERPLEDAPGMWSAVDDIGHSTITAAKNHAVANQGRSRRDSGPTLSSNADDYQVVEASSKGGSTIHFDLTMNTTDPITGNSHLVSSTVAKDHTGNHSLLSFSVTVIISTETLDDGDSGSDPGSLIPLYSVLSAVLGLFAGALVGVGIGMAWDRWNRKEAIVVAKVADPEPSPAAADPKSSDTRERKTSVAVIEMGTPRSPKGKQAEGGEDASSHLSYNSAPEARATPENDSVVRC